MNLSNRADLRDEYASNYAAYCDKYNQLIDSIEKAHIDNTAIDEVIELKEQLTKIKLLMKIDDLFKV